MSDFLVTPEYDYLTYDYNLTTPWKFNVSAGTTFAGAVAVGAEYEYQDYSSSKLKDVDGYELGDQLSVENYLKGVHTFRIGMETRIIPEFSIRAGYNYSSAAFSKMLIVPCLYIARVLILIIRSLRIPLRLVLDTVAV